MQRQREPCRGALHGVGQFTLTGGFWAGVAAVDPRDFNGDGEVNPDDLSDYINAYFSQPPGPGADINGDGEVNPDDLSDYINLYFA